MKSITEKRTTKTRKHEGTKARRRTKTLNAERAKPARVNADRFDGAPRSGACGWPASQATAVEPRRSVASARPCLKDLGLKDLGLKDLAGSARSAVNITRTWRISCVSESDS